MDSTGAGNETTWNRAEQRAAIGLFAAMSSLLIASTILGGCGDDIAPPAGSEDGGADPDAAVDPGEDGGEERDAGPTETAVLPRSSRSRTIDISPDDSFVVMVNREGDNVSIFATEDNTRVATVDTGDEPSAVVIHPDGRRAYVANQADATVTELRDIGGPAPAAGVVVDVGSEPAGLALSPTGKTLFVAEWAEGRVSVVDTESMTVTATIDGPVNPTALAVTNDGDADDGDELLIVPEFFGEPVPGGEGTDSSRTGKVRVYALSDLAASDPIVFEPFDSGFAPDESSPSVMASPNQLHSVVVQQGRIYVTSTSASAAAPVRFNLNVHPVVYVADIAEREELRSADGTQNLARLVREGIPEGDPRFFLADLVDMDFIGTSNIAYALSRGSDVVQRLVYEESGVQIGSDINDQIEVGSAPSGASTGCRTPIGIVTAHDGPRAYLNCWVSRNLGVVDLTAQALSTTVESTPPPTGAEVEVNQGRRFFFTGRGRWSKDGWSSCSSCHPGGHTDNITWSFAAGPRQSTDLAGSFSHGEGEQVQRVFNWTGIFDELHDFERNTRGVSGGLGAVTSGDCGNLAGEVADPAELPGNLAQPIKELQDAGCTTDWDALDAWVRTVRPTRGLRSLDPESVERGRALFGMSTAAANNGQCVTCHGGPGWTASRRFWTPSSSNNGALSSMAFEAPAAWPPTWNDHELQIAAEPGTGAAPPQVACVLRQVGTFGLPGDSAATTALEVRANGAPSQGRGGYNVPSLYGIAVNAPYLHHGQAATLEALLDDPAWQSHLRAANPVFLTTGDVEQQKRDLAAFLLSIDASTAEAPLPSGFDGCVPRFP